MSERAIETIICWYTILILVLYLPIETWTSLPAGLLSPYYLVDLVGMALMGCGVVASLRARPHANPAMLCVGYAWCAANGWRATADRLALLERGESLQLGTIELLAVGGSTLIAIVVMLVLFFQLRRKTAAQ